ncbi:MAG: hypothetical protein ACK5L5_04175 [Bacteroidales bacterium]
MALLGKLFGSDKALDKVASGVDKVFFTQEERAEQWLDTLKAYEPFKLAQRLIALIVTCAYIFVFLLCAVMMFLGLWFDKLVEHSKLIVEWNNDTLGLPFVLIVSFYFAGGMAEGIIQKYKKGK